MSRRVALIPASINGSGTLNLPGPKRKIFQVQKTSGLPDFGDRLAADPKFGKTGSSNLCSGKAAASIAKILHKTIIKQLVHRGIFPFDVASIFKIESAGRIYM